MDKFIGKRLEGRYEIQALIGSGGMSNVYRAYDTIDERTVAVKILREEYLGNAEFLRRFKNESKAIAVLSHPNIVRVLDVSFTGRVHSIVMEYIDGITLKDYIERQGVLSWKEAVHFTLEILKALQHAHDKGIVHRDIKPQNIMLLQSGTIKVTDFGIARFARSEVQTLTDRAIGSVHYISPEQAMGDQTDEKSDLYSVGVMLFEMLTGKLPFEAETAVSVAIKQIQTQAVRPTSINPSIPEGLEDITVRAMQKDAKLRYQSAAEMMRDIERFKQDPSIHFAYKYLSDENETAQKKRYKRTIDQHREEEPMQRAEKRTPYIPILTGVTVAFVLASICFIGLMVYLNNPFKQVDEDSAPNLVGMKFETAVNQYDNFEIVMDEAPVASSEYGRGVIVSQNPRAGRSVKVGGTIHVAVSSGQQVVTLPNFTNRSATEAIAKLREDGLDYEEVLVFSSDVDIGYVVYTNPTRDSQVSGDTVVTLYVSKGPEELPATIPDLTGMSLDDATRLLEFTNLALGEVEYEEASDVPENTVLKQDPAPGGLQPEGTQVNLVVSRMPEETGDGDASQGDSETRPLSIPINLPVTNSEILIEARQDGAVMFSEYLVPSEVGTWNPYFYRRNSDESTIRVYINNRLYIEYVLDFNMKAFRITDDRTQGFWD